MRIDLQRKTKIRGHAVGDVLPAITAIIAAIKAPVILQKESLRIRGMADDLVHALAPLRILLIGWHELRPHTLVAGLPILAAVVGAIDTAGRDGNEHPLIV